MTTPASERELDYLSDLYDAERQKRLAVEDELRITDERRRSERPGQFANEEWENEEWH